MLAEIPSALVLVFVSDALLQRRLAVLFVAVAVVVALVVLGVVLPGLRPRRRVAGRNER